MSLDPAAFVSTLWSGIVIGSVLALLATGLTMIFATTRIVNFMHGAFFMLGAYLVWYLAAGHVSGTGGFVSYRFFSGFLGSSGLMLPFVVAAVVGVIVLFFLGSGYERIIIRPLRQRQGWEYPVLFVTIALAVAVESATLIAFGPRPRTYANPIYPAGAFRPAEGVFITNAEITMFSIAIGVLLLLQLFLKRHRIGMAMRAVSQDGVMALLCGVTITTIFLLTFGLSAALAGLSGILMLSIIDPTVGLLVTWRVFIIVVLGGMGNVTGTIYAAFIVGIIEAFTALLLGSAWVLPLEFGIMIAIIILRPHGLFGLRE